MPSVCAAYNCSNRSKKGDGRSYHRFPKDIHHRKQWIKALKRKFISNEQCKYMKICSDHFRKEDFKTNSVNKMLLKENVVPSLFDFTKHLKSKEKKKGKVLVSQIIEESSEESIDINEDSSNNQEEINNVEIIKNINLDHNYSYPNSIEKFKIKHEKYKELFVQRENEHDELKRKLQNINVNLSEENFNLQNKIDNLEKSIEEKNKFIKILEGKVDEFNSLRLRNSLPPDHFINIDQAIQKNKNNESLIDKLMKKETRQKQYDIDVIEFAKTLRFHSVKAYHFMKKYLSLPSIETLNRHQRSLKCLPGPTNESFNELQMHGDLENSIYENSSLT